MLVSEALRQALTGQPEGRMGLVRSTTKSSLDVSRRHCREVGSLERNKELRLGDMVDVSLDESLIFLADARLSTL